MFFWLDISGSPMLTCEALHYTYCSRTPLRTPAPLIHYTADRHVALPPSSFTVITNNSVVTIPVCVLSAYARKWVSLRAHILGCKTYPCSTSLDKLFSKAVGPRYMPSVGAISCCQSLQLLIFSDCFVAAHLVARNCYFFMVSIYISVCN